jgi:hypothetical protein
VKWILAILSFRASFIGEESALARKTADSSRDKAALRNDKFVNKQFKLHHYQALAGN